MIEPQMHLDLAIAQLRTDLTKRLSEVTSLHTLSTAALFALQPFLRSALSDFAVTPCLLLQTDVLSRLTKYLTSILDRTSPNSNGALQVPSELIEPSLLHELQTLSLSVETAICALDTPGETGSTNSIVQRCLSVFKQQLPSIIKYFQQSINELIALYLEPVCLSFDPEISAEGALAELSEKRGIINSLTLTDCRNLSETTFLAIAERCRELISLSLVSTGATDKAILALAERSDRLAWLDVAYTQITKKGLTQVLDRHRETLRFVGINHGLLSQRTLADLRACYPRIKIHVVFTTPLIAPILSNRALFDHLAREFSEAVSNHDPSETLQIARSPSSHLSRPERQAIRRRKRGRPRISTKE